MTVRIALALPLLFAFASPAFAQPGLDAEASGPTLWRIVLHTEKHPLLTPAFRDQIRRDLIASLQPALGSLGTVDVIELTDALAGKGDALVQDYAAKGFAALDGARDLTGVKTHFLRVEVRDGQYHLEARQHDGFTGLASPLVRKQSTRAPELVGRTAGLMIERDFGLTGTVDPAAAPDAAEVLVSLRGGKIGDVKRFVKEGDVFAVARIKKAANRPAPPPARTATGKIIAPPPGSEPPTALTPEPIAYTWLRVIALDAGGVRCSVIRSPAYKLNLQRGPAFAGFRVMKLSTVQAPLAVRIVNGSDGAAATTPVANVRATEGGFNPKEDPKDFLDFRDGLYRSSRSFSNLACVTIALGKSNAKHFPVPVLDTEPITLRFELSPEAEARAAFERSAIAVSTRAADARVAQVAAFGDIRKLILTQKNKEARDRAIAARDAADATSQLLTEELEVLRPQGEKVPGAPALFANVEQQLKALRGSNVELEATIGTLKAVVAKEEDPTKLASEVSAEALEAHVGICLSSGEVEEALTTLDQLATLLPNNAGIKMRRQKLAAEWKPKDEQHAKEREYMIKTWPALASVSDIKDSLPRLRTAIDTCKKAGDKHAFRRLLSILGGFPVKLTDLVKDLDPNADSARKTIEDVKIIRDLAAKTETEVIEFLKQN
ncbi:MAG: hypothetical protein U0791_11950 [Gemmataceae bacterium]